MVRRMNVPPSRLGLKNSKEHNEKISKGNKGKPKSLSHRTALTNARQKIYSILSPTQERFIVKSGQLPAFCKEHTLNYSNLMNAKNKGIITYKGGWILREISQVPNPIATPIKPEVDF